MNPVHECSRALTRLVLGVDALYRRERGGGSGKLDAEGLVPVHWSPEPAEPLSSWGEALEGLGRIVDDASTLPDPWARDWLAEQALAVRVLVRWFAGEDVPYERLVAGALRVDPRAPTSEDFAALRAQRDRALAAAGYGTGSSGFAAYLERDGVPAGEVVGVMVELTAEARARTLARLPALRLPPDTIGVKAVPGTPFTAYCDYPGRTVWVNTDVPQTRSGLKQLVAHEAYPGHDAHIGHRDALVREGRMPPDAALVVTNSASSVLFEGIAERGLDLLSWREAPEDRIAWWHNRLQTLGAVEAAHALNTGCSSPAEVGRFLRETCDADEAWIEGRLRFVTHRLRAPFVYSYWWGGTVVGEWWSRVPAARLDEAVSHLYDRMHSPTTLAAHWPAGGHL